MTRCLRGEVHFHLYNTSRCTSLYPPTSRKKLQLPALQSDLQSVLLPTIGFSIKFCVSLISNHVQLALSYFFNSILEPNVDSIRNLHPIEFVPIFLMKSCDTVTRIRRDRFNLRRRDRLKLYLESRISTGKLHAIRLVDANEVFHYSRCIVR